MTPRATYRVQFHKGFTFDDGAALAPYLSRLGVSHLYSSPILTARAGSTHGYDGVDPTSVNPELGGEEAFRRMVAALRRHDLGLIVDIVPNHLAVGGADNAWWLDVLENGPASPHAGTFDIDFDPIDPALKDKVHAPFLGSAYGDALAAGDITLVWDEGLQRLAAAYFHHRFPIRPEDYAEILRGAPDLAALTTRFPGADREAFAAARAELAAEAGELGSALEPYRDPARLHGLLERQHYRLSWWRTAGDEINWRRFFDITELAGLRVEEPEVFDAVHAVIFGFYAEGLIDGVRVDHVDGLADPAGYCRMLRERLAALDARRPAEAPPGPAYIVVEKILGPDEDLSTDWQVDGTTGYDFMNQVSGLQHDPDGEDALTELWAEVSGRFPDFEDEELEARNELLVRAFAGQLEACTRAFHRLARGAIDTRDVTHAALRRGLTTLLAAFPAYRTYATAGGAPGSDAPILARAVDAAKDMAASGEEGVIDLIAAWLTGGEGSDPEDRRNAVVRFQQLSAPIAAKAVEDTAFYRYGRLLSRNDVGFEAGRFAIPPEAFHGACADRAAHFPAAMLATATHDHKRGEDVRARLAAISEDPARWTEHVGEWFDANRRFSDDVIDPGDEYQLYQTMVGAWPLDLDPADAAGLRTFRERLHGWQVKALREGKVNSSWMEPSTEYEADCRRFLETITDPSASSSFLRGVHAYANAIAPIGALNGLAQAFLRNTVPGVPDCYQGAEFWDFSLVDPDNRRPVDYAAREAGLANGQDWPALMAAWRDGRVKQALIARCLEARRGAPNLFARGDYLPLVPRGQRADSVVAFARRDSSSALVAAACRLAGKRIGVDRPLPDPEWWGDTTIAIPADLAGTDLADALGTGVFGSGLPRALRARDLFSVLPVALGIVV